MGYSAGDFGLNTIALHLIIKKKNGAYNKILITIEDNVWIGANVVVLPGVIGAGSVVTKDIPENVIAFGSPCKVYREINERDEEYYFMDRRFDEQPE